MPRAEASRYLRRGRPISGKKTFTRSFSIENDVIEKLNACSKSKGMTTNSLVNSVLKSYANDTANAEKHGYLIFSKKTLSEMLKGMDDKSIPLAAKNAGGIAYQRWCMENDSTPSIEGFLIFTRRLCDWAKWAQYEEEYHAEKLILKLYHDYDETWSRFFQSYLDSVLAIVCADKMRKYRISVLEKTVLVTISL
jgi:hypothetical protein